MRLLTQILIKIIAWSIVAGILFRRGFRRMLWEIRYFRLRKKIGLVDFNHEYDGIENAGRPMLLDSFMTPNEYRLQQDLYPNSNGVICTPGANGDLKIQQNRTFETEIHSLCYFDENIYGGSHKGGLFKFDGRSAWVQVVESQAQSAEVQLTWDDLLPD